MDGWIRVLEIVTSFARSAHCVLHNTSGKILYIFSAVILALGGGDSSLLYREDIDGHDLGGHR